ncbi:carbohydrate ABC transporter permease [Chloroflexi bacterium TSY]|nr:carbohydrate ABC transporter permease [Chloroflexi bacterium TSY]
MTTISESTVKSNKASSSLSTFFYRWRGGTLNLTMLVVTVIFLWPVILLVGLTLNDPNTYLNPLLPFPSTITFQNYIEGLTEYGTLQAFFNTIIVVGTSTLFGTIFSALAGFALAKLQFPGRRILFLVIIAVMLLPAETMIIPAYVVMRELGILNTWWAIILSAVGGSAFNIFLMRQFMLQVPTEMLEAGRIDGCSEFRLFSSLVMPVMKGPIFVVATLAARAGWNSLLWPQVMISDADKGLLMPQIVSIYEIAAYRYGANIVAAAMALLGALVPLALYIYTQRFFVDTLAGSVKS